MKCLRKLTSDKAIEVVQKLGKQGALTGSDKTLPAELEAEKNRMQMPSVTT